MILSLTSTIANYRLLSNTITPRPIALITSSNENGLINIAPFSFFGVVSSDPVVFSLCLTLKSDGSPKDTFKNAIATKKLTINMPTLDFLESIEKTAQELDSTQSEASFFRIPLESIDCAYPPILSGIKVAYFCEFLEILEFGNYNKTLLLQAKSAYVEDELFREDLNFTPLHLGRVGKFFLDPSNLINPKAKK